MSQVDFESETDSPSSPASASRIPNTAAPTWQSSDATSLRQLEDFLLEVHPQLAKARSQINELTGKQIQSVLQPNPRVGVTAEDINAADGAGRYGVFFGRKVIRGNKLGLAGSVVEAEIDVARQKYDAIKQGLQVELRKRYYQLLIADEKVRLADELVSVVEKSVTASERLFEAEEIAKAPLLRSELELEQTQLIRQRAQNQRLALSRRLASLLGQDQVDFGKLVGNIEDLQPLGDFEAAFDKLLASHPELSAAIADVQRSHRTLARETATPIPDITWQTSVLYDFTTDEVVGGFQIGFPLAIRNQNQGNIQQATSAIQTAQHALDQKTLELRDRLNTAWAAFTDAKIQTQAYDTRIAAKATQALELAAAGYEQGETPFLDLLVAQKFFSQTRLDYLAQLEQMWLRRLEIEGLMANWSDVYKPPPTLPPQTDDPPAEAFPTMQTSAAPDQS